MSAGLSEKGGRYESNKQSTMYVCVSEEEQGKGRGGEWSHL